MAMRAWRRDRLAVAAWAAAGLLAISGCTRKPELPAPVDVTGEVKFADGRSITGMIICFHADDELTGRGKSPTGVLDEAGKFAISGVTPGRYRVTLAPIPVGAGQAANAKQLNSPGQVDKKTAVPGEYLNSGSTPWRATIESPPKTLKFVLGPR
jgi:hypothetical protein